MKKVLALLLSFTLVFSMVACSSSSDSSSEDTAEEVEEEAEVEEEEEEEVEEEVEEEAEEEAEEVSADTGDYGDPENADMKFAWWGNQVRTDNTNEAIAIYEEAHPGVSIEGQAYQWDDYWTVLATQAAGDSLPDLMQHDYAYIGQYQAAGLNLDLKPFSENGMLDLSDVTDEIIATGTVNGEIVAVCAGVNAPSMIYNKTLTDSIGLEIKDNMTWDEFADYSRQIYEETGYKTQYGYGASENPQTYYIRSQGYTSLFTETGLSYEDDGYEVMTEYYQRLIDGLDEGWLMDSATLSGLDTSSIEMNPLVYGTDPQFMSWEACAFSNQITAYQEVTEDELAATCWPSSDPEASNYMKPSQFFSISRDVTNVAAAMQFLDALINDVEVNEALKGERGVPASSVVAEALKDEGLLNEVEYDYLYGVAAECCSDIFEALPDTTSEVINGPMCDIAEEVLYGIKDADTAAKDFFDQTLAIMGG